MSNSFVKENLHNGFGFGFECDEVLFEEKSEHQDVLIFKNKFFNKVLMLDGVTQLTLKDEFVYHEMMVHVPLFSIQNPENVLIIGGGDGGIAREVLKHKSIKSCTLVEIDRSVIDMSLKYLPEVSDGAFSHSKMDLIIEDGMKFLKETQKKFDVIIVDSTDPHGPGAVLFTKEFYHLCKRAMKKASLLITQNGAPIFQSNELHRTSIYLGEVFNFNTFYLAHVPTYIGGMCIGYTSDNEELFNIKIEAIRTRFEKSEIYTKYYNPEIHKGAFMLPTFIKNITNY